MARQTYISRGVERPCMHTHPPTDAAEADRICRQLLELVRAVTGDERPVAVTRDRSLPSPVYREYERLVGIDNREVA